jgi:hypothetical protein
MSIEFKARIGRKLSDQSIAAVMRYIASHSSYTVIRDVNGEIGLGQGAPGAMGRVPEVITLQIGDQEPYVAFHAGNKADRVLFLKVLKEAIQEESTIGEFEEL